MCSVQLTVPLALNAYLSARTTDPSGQVYESSFAALLRDARGATARDASTGSLAPAEAYRGRSWLGALGYLCLLDQIGSAVRPKRGPTLPIKQSRPPAFLRCLERFAPDLVVSPSDRSALYGLRCALAQDYSLMNIGGDGRVRGKAAADKTHAFNFTCDDTSPLVLHARTPWRRSTWLPRERHTTVVNLYKVGNLAEEVVARVRRMHRAGRLRINDEYVRSPRELVVRYGLSYQA